MDMTYTLCYGYGHSSLRIQVIPPYLDLGAYLG